MRAALGALKSAERPEPFYAILSMDGDSLGMHLQDPANQSAIANALTTFAAAAQGTVSDHNGFLVYTGGDDVLALLPLEDALPCAARLRSEFEQAFSGTGISATISAAIVFAHVKMPLGSMLRDSHELLNDIAKEQSGRSSVAVRVWRPGTLTLEWVCPWKQALDADGQVEVQSLAAAFAGNEPDFSSKFFFRIGELFALLNPSAESADSGISDQQAVQLLAARYLASGSHDRRPTVVTRNQAEAIVGPLLRQCRPVRRAIASDGAESFHYSPRVEEAAAMLIRFLATKGGDL